MLGDLTYAALSLDVGIVLFDDIRVNTTKPLNCPPIECSVERRVEPSLLPLTYPINRQYFFANTY